ncbi:MAG: DNA repair protein RecO [Paracoccaceae bacterium]
MEWRDEGVLLAARRHGESSVIIEVLTSTRGRHAGVVRGGASRKMSPILQPGAQLDLQWRARLEDHLGSFTVELIRSRAGNVMDDRLALAGLNAVTALLTFALPERESYPTLYRKTLGVLDLLDQPELWPLAYLQWELALLEGLGFGLDLNTCAATGATEGLVFVSPRTGRAVSRKGAGEWADRMLPLPPVLLRRGNAPDAEIIEALHTTGYFLTHHLAADLGGRPLPEARRRLIDALQRHAVI